LNYGDIKSINYLRAYLPASGGEGSYSIQCLSAFGGNYGDEKCTCNYTIFCPKNQDVIE